jgi:hypothetical protein
MPWEEGRFWTGGRVVSAGWRVVYGWKGRKRAEFGDLAGRWARGIG